MRTAFPRRDEDDFCDHNWRVEVCIISDRYGRLRGSLLTWISTSIKGKNYLGTMGWRRYQASLQGRRRRQGGPPGRSGGRWRSRPRYSPGDVARLAASGWW